MKKLLEILRDQNIPTQQKEVALADLQYFVEDLDNANDLNKIGGVTVIKKFLSDPSTKLRFWAAYIVGSLVQNNPESQKIVMEQGFIPILLELLAKEEDQEVLGKVLMAVSGLIRNNETGQRALKLGSFFSLAADILKRSSTTLRTKVKTVLTVKHFCNSKKEYQDVVREQKILDMLPPLIESEDCDLRGQALEALYAATMDNRQNVSVCKRLKLPEHLERRISMIQGNEELETELDMCRNLSESLAYEAGNQ